ncbi:DUF427 domain-containing protein [Dactylosporangium sp. CA-139066]|uniref:DUF427 domain-containing protein n=1 Tax=Dactylosporangium sp. CA-139066 TaxID=3239930 RepID=UPI003D8F0969
METNRGRIRVEPGAKRVRAYLGGVPVADTVRPLLVWEGPHYPAYYLPAADVREDLITPDGERAHSPSRGDARRGTISAGGRTAAGAALYYDDSPIEEIRGHYRFDWNALDAWFEEDEEVFTHPRDPYTRVDILTSSRLVRVAVGGVTVAESTSPRMLFETGLPVRYYLPKPHVRMDLLEPTDTVTTCPYKGTAQYWSVRIGDTLHADIVWSYRTPLPESRAIAGLLCFYNEKADITVAPD